VDPYYLPLGASATVQTTWATDYDLVPEPTPQAQWCYPAVNSAYGDSAHFSNAHAPSASSDSISWGLPHESHPTVYTSSEPFGSSSSVESSFSWDGSMPSSDFGGLETSRFSGSESSMACRSDETGVEAEQESAQPESVRSFFLQVVHLSSIRWLTPCFRENNRHQLSGLTVRSWRLWHSRHPTRHTSGMRGSPSWRPIWVCRAVQPEKTLLHSSFKSRP
jgi:hypothetical protein